MIRHASHRLLATLAALPFVIPFTPNARGQTPESSPRSLESEIQSVRADNAAVKEQLRSLEEQQKKLLDLITGLQQRLEGSPSAIGTGQSPSREPVLPVAPPVAPPKPAAPAAQPDTDRNIAAEKPYEDSIVLVKTPEDAKIPVLLRF